MLWNIIRNKPSESLYEKLNVTQIDKHKCGKDKGDKMIII